MAFTGIESASVSTLECLIAYPLTGYYYFYAWILFAIWSVIGFSLYFAERLRQGKANFLSSFAVSSVSTILIAVAGSLISNANGCTVITKDILLATIVLCSMVIAIWWVLDN